MNAMVSIMKRELREYFTTPVAYVFIVIFLFLTGLFTFKASGFFETGQADLRGFFNWHPWLYLFLIPAIAMSLWAEERKSGTIELLFTLPVSMAQAILGKFIAAWIFIGVALALTFPMVLTVMYLGQPDFASIATAYIGSFLMAGAYLAIGICVSALTRTQVISFIISLVLSLLILLAGFDLVLDFFSRWAPDWLIEALAQMSFLTHFRFLQLGVINLPDIIYFLSIIVGALVACSVILEMKKAE